MILHRTGLAVLAASVLSAAVGLAEGGRPTGNYPRSRAEIPRITVYAPPSYQAIPPPTPYASGYWGGLRYQPPMGFGSPYYNGYNDPYFRSYGPGVQEFLRFGGADFYGW
jgi:hypothetical protein